MWWRMKKKMLTYQQNKTASRAFTIDIFITLNMISPYEYNLGEAIMENVQYVSPSNSLVS